MIPEIFQWSNIAAKAFCPAANGFGSSIAEIDSRCRWSVTLDAFSLFVEAEFCTVGAPVAGASCPLSMACAQV